MELNTYDQYCHARILYKINKCNEHSFGIHFNYILVFRFYINTQELRFRKKIQIPKIHLLEAMDGFFNVTCRNAKYHVYVYYSNGAVEKIEEVLLVNRR